jgi:hypothetical protein
VNESAFFFYLYLNGFKEGDQVGSDDSETENSTQRKEPVVKNDSHFLSKPATFSKVKGQ